MGWDLDGIVSGSIVVAYPAGHVEATRIVGPALLRRKEVLAELGMHAAVSRASWSHDRGDAIVFDAWQHQWMTDTSGNLDRYPVRTTEHGLYNLQEAVNEPRRGHTRWQRHVDLVLGGRRAALAIVPVAKDPSAKPNRWSKGWLPQYLAGEIQEDTPGNFYFHAKEVVRI